MRVLSVLATTILLTGIAVAQDMSPNTFDINGKIYDWIDEETYCERHAQDIVCGGSEKAKQPNLYLPPVGGLMTYSDYETAILKGELAPYDKDWIMPGGLYEYCLTHSSEIVCGGTDQAKNPNHPIKNCDAEQTVGLLEQMISDGDMLPLNKMEVKYQKGYGKCNC